MISAGQHRPTLVPGLSGPAHLGVFLVLAAKHPRLQAAAPPSTFDVTIVAKFVAPVRPPPTASRCGGAEALRLGRMETSRRLSPTSSLPARQPQPSPASLGKALRRGPVGCANLGAQDQAETDACLEAFGKGATSAAFITPPMARDKRTGFDEKVAAQEQMRIYRETGVCSGLRDALKAAR